MAARAALLVLAVVTCLWLVAGLRSSRLVTDAESGFSPDATASEVERRLDQLRDARSLNPDPTPRIREAQLLVVAGRDREAVRAVRDVVREEPENYEAWLGLRQAAFTVDPPTARRATREAIRLNPLARERAAQR